MKSQTAGEGSYSIAFARLAPMPAVEQQKVMAAAVKKQEED